MACGTVSEVAKRMTRISPKLAANRTGFQRFAWGVLAFNIAVILWGAYVRATSSGAGCGGHWPLCNGAVVPRAPSLETFIEYTHRLSSGLALSAVLALLVWSFRAFPRGSRVRGAAVFASACLVIEALLGAGLVLFHYVAHNESVARVAFLSLHQVNTLLLVCVLTATAWLAGSSDRAPDFRVVPHLLWSALGAVLLVAVTGTIAALGDTLYPAASVAAAVRQEFSGAASFLVRLRVLHPLLAVGTVFLVLFAISTALREKLCARRTALVAVAFAVLQLAAGAVNIMLLAPVWMQMVHLLIADLLWIALCVLGLEAATFMRAHPDRTAKSGIL